MSKKFSISQGMLNSVSQNVKKANEIEAKNNFNVQYIDIKDIERNYYDGIGKPEPLKGNLSGWWSRRIDDTNRLVYRINNNIL